MTYINIAKFVLINQLEKDHSTIEARRFKNVVVFIQTILSFVLSRKSIKILTPRAMKTHIQISYKQGKLEGRRCVQEL